MLTLIQVGCYHFARHDTTISIPYVQGDYEGNLTAALVREIVSTGVYSYKRSDARYELQVEVARSDDAKIGFQYDRKQNSAALAKRLLANENRKTLTAKASLVDAYTGKIVYGPIEVSGYGEFDYVTGDSAQFLSFVNSSGLRQSTLNFSLGQLDSIEGAEIDALEPIYQMLAKKISRALLLKNNITQ